MWTKTVTWPDGTTETIRIGDRGKIFLNGVETVAFGFNIHTFPYWYAYEHPEIADKQLDWLAEHGVRFMLPSMGSWRNTEADFKEFLDFWLPRLYERKMWVCFCVQESPDGNINPDITYNRISNIINCITEPKYADIIYALGYSWEIDDYGYSDSEVENYLSTLYPMIRGLIRGSLIKEVPLIAKHSATISTTGTIPAVKWSDIPAWDFYTSTVPDDRINTYINQTLPQAGKPDDMAFWFTESGHGSKDNIHYTPDFFQWLLNPYGYGRVSSLFLWIMEAPPDWGTYLYEAFDDDGNPKQWLIDLAPYFPKQPTPTPSIEPFFPKIREMLYDFPKIAQVYDKVDEIRVKRAEEGLLRRG